MHTALRSRQLMAAAAQVGGGPDLPCGVQQFRADTYAAHSPELRSYTLGERRDLGQMTPRLTNSACSSQMPPFFTGPGCCFRQNCNGAVSPARLGEGRFGGRVGELSEEAWRGPGRLKPTANALPLWLAAASAHCRGWARAAPSCWGLPCPAQIGLRPRIMMDALHSAQATWDAERNLRCCWC
jgi:hypothetical protein